MLKEVGKGGGNGRNVNVVAALNGVYNVINRQFITTVVSTDMFKEGGTRMDGVFADKTFSLSE